MPIVGLAVLLLVALLARFVALLVPGHNGDTYIMDTWAEAMASVGPGHVYDQVTSVYPALLYPLWPLGVAFDGQPLDLLVKGLSIPFDLGLGVAIALVTARLASPRAALVTAGLYLLNPAAILAGPVWGQVDAAGTLAFLGALVAAAGRRPGLAGGLGVLAGMLKPQFGLVLLPVAAVCVLDALRGRGRGGPLRMLLVGVAVYAVIAAPLALDPARYLGELTNIANFRPFASLHAMNPWGLLMGFETPERGLGWLGLALLLAGLVASVAPLRRRSDLPALLASGAFVAFAFYFLPTRSHERYLFPVLAVLAPLAVRSPRELAAYAALSLAFAASLLYTLVDITPLRLPSPIQSALLTSAAVWVIGIALMGSALAWVLLAWRRTFAPFDTAGARERPPTVTAAGVGP